MADEVVLYRSGRVEGVTLDLVLLGEPLWRGEPLDPAAPASPGAEAITRQGNEEGSGR